MSLAYRNYAVVKEELRIRYLYNKWSEIAIICPIVFMLIAFSMPMVLVVCSRTWGDNAVGHTTYGNTGSNPVKSHFTQGATIDEGWSTDLNKHWVTETRD